MSTAYDTIYWAERAIGEPFQAPDLPTLRRKYMHASMVSGLAFVSTVAIGAAAAWFLIPERPQRIVLAQFSYAAQLAEPRPAAVAPGAPSTSTAAPITPVPGPTRITKDPISPAAPPVQLARGSATRSGTSPPRSTNSAPVRDRPAKPRTIEAPTPRPAGDLVEEMPERPSVPAPVPPGAPIPAAAPIASRSGLSAGAATKPQDIAPSEKLGVREVFAEGIELLNGKRIRNGERLPNGEMLQATDPAKGMVETDRRVMTIVR